MSFPLRFLRFLNNDTRGLAIRFLVYAASAHSVLARFNSLFGVSPVLLCPLTVR